ncbi:MAG TPA: LEA type 2 family protein [Trueperaceae bacterium]
MKRRTPVLLALACVALLVAGCAPRTEIRRTEQIQDILPPVFELVPGQTSIERFDPPGAGAMLEMTVGTLVRNPNQYPVKVESITYDVFLEGVRAVRGAIAPDVYLEPDATAPVSFLVTTDLAGRNELFEAAARAFVDRPLEFSIEGSIRFSSASYAFETRPKELLAGSTFARRTAQAPLLSLDEQASRVYELSPGVPVAQVVLLANNPGDIGYFLHGKELTLMLGGWPVATEDMSPVPIAAGETARVDLLFYPVTSSLGEESMTALRAAMDGYATLIRLEGDLFMDVLGVDSFPVPSGWSVTGFVH